MPTSISEREFHKEIKMHEFLITEFGVFVNRNNITFIRHVQEGDTWMSVANCDPEEQDSYIILRRGFSTKEEAITWTQEYLSETFKNK